MNEHEIIKGCLKNDRASQKALYEQYYSKMLGVCLRYAKDKDEAKDILHEGFLKVFNSLKNFNGSGSFEGWIRRIMANTSIDHLRKNKQNYLIVSTVYANEKASNMIDEIDEDELINIDKEEILKAVQELTPAYRTVFNLYVIEEFTHREIAEMLDISEGTSKSNLSKAKFNLKKNLMHLIKATHGK
ncbi:MAG: polymerase, sigma-24 subunit, subfamily [Bacteroidota bacterium]|jgi:RNA polymerase sigma-70 factor (ECF subfamily)|nr:polymerase, sigma-24 subunit, subfamily [Bacteroidota bacterium]